jgi:NTP pyrophosphatase (non-canonical NTP hydrolase)
MDFKDYQEKAKTTAIYLNKLKEKFELPDDIWKMLGVSYVGLGMGEVGEVQGKLKKIIRDSGGVISEDAKKELSKELGDCLWYIALMCEELGLCMEEVAEENINKLFSRKTRGVLGGSGDNR